MEIDFKNPAVKVGFNVVQQIDLCWKEIENRQEFVDKGEAGILEDPKGLKLIIFYSDGHKDVIIFNKQEWLWYKFFKKRNLGLQ